MGSSEKLTKSDTSTAQAMVSAKGLKYCPANPFMKPTGRNTTTMAAVVASTARPISFVPSRDAVTWSLPISTCRTMFSRTTMASSMRMPMASDSPSSDMVSSLKPNAHTAMKLARTDTGSASPVMTVDRQLLRKTNTTSTVSTAPSSRVFCTSHTASAVRVPASCTMRTVRPAGSVRSAVARRARSPSATVVALTPRRLRTSSVTAACPSTRAEVRASAAAMRTSATSRSRTTRPPLATSGSAANASALSGRP